MGIKKEMLDENYWGKTPMENKITLKDLLNLAFIEDLITVQEYLRMEELEDKELKEELIKITNREWRINTKS